MRAAPLIFLRMCSSNAIAFSQTGLQSYFSKIQKIRMLSILPRKHKHYVNQSIPNHGIKLCNNKLHKLTHTHVFTLAKERLRDVWNIFPLLFDAEESYLAMKENEAVWIYQLPFYSYFLSNSVPG